MTWAQIILFAGIVLLVVSMPGCCLLRSGFDGKAASWCEAKERAEFLCSENGGVAGVDTGGAVCRDGTERRFRR